MHQFSIMHHGFVAVCLVVAAIVLVVMALVCVRYFAWRDYNAKRKYLKDISSNATPSGLNRKARRKIAAINRSKEK